MLNTASAPGHRLAKGNWATLAELARVGYAELTMERVAERAKAGKRRCTAGARAGWSWCWPRFTAPGRNRLRRWTPGACAEISSR
ncbi:hypothetical protein [Saccharopolyspora hattusasensis]|uniref:hypothetical protein n=1 Tax=Saccharopolyspora hattusasensis TaxID=1128679 RepID=UPI003D993732